MEMLAGLFWNFTFKGFTGTGSFFSHLITPYL
jgi:hypothetical protein